MILSGIVTFPPPATLRNRNSPVRNAFRMSSIQWYTLSSKFPTKAKVVFGRLELGMATHRDQHEHHRHQECEGEAQRASVIGQHGPGQPIPRTAAPRPRTG